MNISIGRFFQWVEVRSHPFRDGKREVTPVARRLSLMLAWRGFPLAGQFVWTRPVAVEVVEDRTVRRIPIHDYGMWIALGITIATAFVALLSSSRKAVGA